MIDKKLKNFIKKNHTIIWIICAVIAYILPLIFFLHKTYTGAFPFWYDPARDMLQAIESTKKVGLIGPPSGIPGLFYGPYWIWLLSIAVSINRDPRMAVFVAGIIPYFTLFPFLLYKLKDVLGRYTILIVFLLFMLGFNHYATTLWNPHPAPLIFLGIIALITFSDFLPFTKRSVIQLLSLGLITGLLVNFHISFGIGVTFGLVLYLLYLIIKNKDIVFIQKKWYIPFFVYAFFGIGIVIAFIPFVLFEARHNFLQTHTILNTLSQSIFYNAPVVGLKGLSKGEILFNFVNTFSRIFKIPAILGIVGFMSFLLYSAYSTFSHRKTTVEKSRTIVSLLCIGIGILFIYLTSKNPVWEYHFYGVEILMILLIAALSYKDKILSYGFFLLSAFSLVYQLFGYTNSLFVDPNTFISSYSSNNNIVEYIYSTSQKDRAFAVFAYSPSIYTYEFDYLFNWRGKDFGRLPLKDSINTDTVYLILPPAKLAVQKDFIENKTPDSLYKTTSIKIFPDKTQVVTRRFIHSSI